MNELVDALQNETTAAKRVSLWHSKMASVQLSELKLSRQLGKEKQGHESVKRELQSTLQRVQELEEEQVRLIMEYDSNQLNLERRLNELEGMVQSFEEEREQIFVTTSASDVNIYYYD